MKKIVALTSLSATLLSTAALAACSGNSAPTETIGTPPPSTSASAPAATPSNAAPKIPTAATKRTPEGAVAFVKYWFDLANYARMNPAKGMLDQYSEPSCKWCQEVDDDLVYLAKEQARFDKPGYKVSDLKSLGVGPRTQAVTFTLSDLQVTVRNNDGDVTDKVAPSELRSIAAVNWTGDRWALSSLTEATR